MPRHLYALRSSALLALAVLCALFPCGMVSATSYTWSGNGGNLLWSTGGNWGGVAPAAGADLIFAGSNNTGTASNPLNQNLANPFVLNSVNFAVGAGSFFLGGYDLRFGGPSGAITQDSASAQTMSMLIRGPSSGVVTLTLGGDGTGLVTLSGAIENGNSGRDYVLVKSGSSTFSLTGVNTYGGGTTIDGGTLIVNSTSSLGGGGATVNAGTLEVATGFSTTRAFTLGSASSTFQIDPSQTFTVTTAIGGSGVLNKTGAGTMVLSAVNGYTGGTVVSAGTLQISASDRIGNLTSLTVSGGTFSLQTFNETVGTVTLTSGSITGSGTLTGSSYGLQSGTISAILGGGAAVNKTTAGAVTLSGANTYTGGTSINGGTLVLGSSGALGTSGTIGFGGGTLQYSASNTTDYSSRLSNAVNQTYSIDTNGQSVTFATGLTSSGGSLTKLGSGTLTLSGSNSFTGGTVVSAGTLQIGAADRLLDAGALTVSGGTFGLQSFVETVGAVTLTSGSITGTGILTGTSLDLQSGSVSAVLAGVTGVTKSTSGSVILSGLNLYTGNTAVNAGILQVNTNGALGTAGSGTTVASGAALKLNGVNYSTAEALTLNGSGISYGGALVNTGTSTYAGAITAATNATVNAGGGTLNLTGGLVKNGTTLTLTGGGTINVNTVGISGSSANSDLVVDGTTVVLNAANSYNGPTTIQNSGVLQLGGNNFLPTSPQTAMTVNTSSTFNLAGNSDSVASLAGDSTATVKNSVTSSTSTLTVNPTTGISTTFAGTIAGTNGGTQGNMALVKTGAGALTLTGSNSYSGATTISGGTLIVANTSGPALTATSTIVVNSGGTLLLGASNQINNTTPVTLAGGTFGKGDFSEGSASVTNTAGVGALTLTATGSRLDFGSGTTGAMTFASFTPGSFTLAIDNWTGTVNTLGSSTTDRLIFNSDQTANLSSFNFTGYAPGATQFNLGNGFYEIAPTAVPEPSTYAAGTLALLVLGWYHIRRRRSLRPCRATVPGCRSIL